MGNWPWSSYTLPSGCKVFLTSRPDRYVEGRQSFNDLFGQSTGYKPTIRIYFTCDPIVGSMGERSVWVPWFVESHLREGDNPTLSSIATAVSLIKQYESPKSVIWLHCDSSSMRAPTFFGLFLNAYYNEQIDGILSTIMTNMPENYQWSSPKRYAQIDLDRDPKVHALLREIKDRL